MPKSLSNLIAEPAKRCAHLNQVYVLGPGGTMTRTVDELSSKSYETQHFIVGTTNAVSLPFSASPRAPWPRRAAPTPPDSPQAPF